MNELFFRVLNMSLAASLVCAALLLLRAAFRNRLPRWAFYCTWALVLARMLIPLSLPSPVSAFGAVPAAKLQEMQGGAALSFVEDSGTTVNFPTLQRALEDSSTPKIVRVPVSAAVIFTAIWLSGMVLLLLYSAGCYGYTLHLLKSALSLARAPEIDALILRAGVNPERVRLCVSGAFGTPVVCGLFRPRLVLSSLVSPADLPHVLAHELTHIRRRDNLWKALATLALYLHWFNPLLWYCYRSYVTDMEASCDEAVVRREDCDRKAYAVSLLNMAVKSRSAFSGGFLAFGECALKERIQSIMNVKKYAVIVTIVCIAMITGLAAVFLTNPIAVPTQAPVPEPPPSAAPITAESSQPAESSSSEDRSSLASETFKASESASSAKSPSTDSAASSASSALPQSKSPAFVEPNPDSPAAFQISFGQADYYNLIDRDAHTYCAVSDEAGVIELTNLINGFSAESNVTDVPDEANVRLLQIRFQDGTKQEYWCHNNLVMVDGKAYKMNAGLRALYGRMDAEIAANSGRMGAEWLGFMNPFRITSVNLNGGENSSEKITLTATATDAQRMAILELSAALKSLVVDPAATRQFPRGEAEAGMPFLYRTELVFENGAEHYIITLYGDRTVLISVASISYELAYRAQDASFQSLCDIIQSAFNS